MIFQGIYLNKPYNKFTEWFDNMVSRMSNVDENIKLIEANRIMNNSGGNVFNEVRKSFEKYNLSSNEIDKLHKNDKSSTLLPLLIATNKNLSIIDEKGNSDDFFVGQIIKCFDGKSEIKMSSQATKNMWNFYLISNYSDRYPYTKEMVRAAIEKCLKDGVEQNKKMPRVLSDAFYVGADPEDIKIYLDNKGVDSDFELRMKKLAQRKRQQELGMRNVLYEMICNGWENKSKIISNSIMWTSGAAVVGLTSSWLVMGLVVAIGAYHSRPKNSEKNEQTLLDLITKRSTHNPAEEIKINNDAISASCFNIIGRIYTTKPEKLTEEFLDLNAKLLQAVIGGNNAVIEKVKEFKNIQDLDLMAFVANNNLDKKQLALLEKIDILGTIDKVERPETKIPAIVEKLIEQNNIGEEYSVIIKSFAKCTMGLNERSQLNKGYDSNIQTVEDFFVDIYKIIEKEEVKSEGSKIIIELISKKVDELLKEHTYENGLKLNNDILQKNSGNNFLHVKSINRLSESYKLNFGESGDIVISMLRELIDIEPKKSSKVPLEVVNENILKIRNDSISNQVKNLSSTIR